MADHAVRSWPGITPAPGAKLEPDAIGAAQDTIIGMASSAPAAAVGLTFAGLTATAAYGGGLILLLTAIPMLIIANAYRRCNLCDANCGASFEWVGRAINPYLGFLTGWLMIAAYSIGTVAEVLILGPSVLSVSARVPRTNGPSSASASRWASSCS
jgi:amino acid transporter